MDCAGESGTACEFVVTAAAKGGSAIKLRNVAQPHFYLAVINGYFVGYVSRCMAMEAFYYNSCEPPPSLALSHAPHTLTYPAQKKQYWEEVEGEREEYYTCKQQAKVANHHFKVM